MLEEAKLCQTKLIPIPKIHRETLKIKVNRINKSVFQMESHYFQVSKRKEIVSYILDFRTLNKRIKNNFFPMPKIQDFLLNFVRYYTPQYHNYV